MKDWKYIEGAKTGNGVFSIFKSDKPIKMKSPQGAIVTINPDGTAAHQDKEGSQMAVHPHNSFKEAVEYYKSQGYVKVSNESLGEYMAKKPRVINEEKTGAEEFFKKLSDDVKEREKKDDAEIEKVGNTKDKNDRDMKIGDMVDVHGKKGKIQKIITAKDSRDDVIEVFFDNSGTYNPDRTDRFYANEVVKVGNAKTGNKKLKFTDKKDGKIEYVYDEESKDGYIYYDGKLVDTKKAVGPGWVDLIKQKAFSSGVMNKTGNAAATFFIIAPNGEKVKAIDYDQWHYKCVDTGELVEKRFSKRIGNSASDDKFAYVMREFDEGKLKTPDGKVVTDPAQAKAIAYSESKKTENGLARARNAIKKS